MGSVEGQWARPAVARAPEALSPGFRACGDGLGVATEAWPRVTAAGAPASPAPKTSRSRASCAALSDVFSTRGW